MLPLFILHVLLDLLGDQKLELLEINHQITCEQTLAHSFLASDKDCHHLVGLNLRWRERLILHHGCVFILFCSLDDVLDDSFDLVSPFIDLVVEHLIGVVEVEHHRVVVDFY